MDAITTFRLRDFIPSEYITQFHLYQAKNYEKLSTFLCGVSAGLLCTASSLSHYTAPQKFLGYGLVVELRKAGTSALIITLRKRFTLHLSIQLHTHEIWNYHVKIIRKVNALPLNTWKCSLSEYDDINYFISKSTEHRHDVRQLES